MLNSCLIVNGVSNKNKGKKTCEEWVGRKSSLPHLRNYGCLAKLNIPISKKHQLRPKTMDCVFLNYYAHWTIAYKFLVAKSKVFDMRVDTIMESSDETFF